MWRKIFNVFSFLFLSLFMASCGLIGQDAVVVPSYIYIPHFKFQTDFATQGDTSHQITDMWLSSKGMSLGAIGLPTLLPIQQTGLTPITVDAGVLNTGQAEVRINYPLMASYIQNVDLTPGQVDTIIPVFKYLPSVEMGFIEDYDRVGTNFVVNPSPGFYLPGDTVLKVNDANAWVPGRNSGKVVIAQGHQLLQLIAGGLKNSANQFEGYDLPAPGTPIYLEIDYKSNLPIDIGYYYIQPGSGVVSQIKSVIQTFVTNGAWKKLYIDLTDEVAAQQADARFIFYIGLYNIENLTPDVYLDNIKLVYLK